MAAPSGHHISLMARLFPSKSTETAMVISEPQKVDGAVNFEQPVKDLLNAVEMEWARYDHVKRGSLSLETVVEDNVRPLVEERYLSAGCKAVKTLLDKMLEQLKMVELDVFDDQLPFHLKQHQLKLIAFPEIFNGLKSIRSEYEGFIHIPRIHRKGSSTSSSTHRSVVQSPFDEHVGAKMGVFHSVPPPTVRREPREALDLLSMSKSQYAKAEPPEREFIAYTAGHHPPEAVKELLAGI